MASFTKEFLLEDAKRLNPDTGRALFLAAFGKHPAWKDHLEPIGLGTDTLVMAAERLYDQGIGGKGGPITSGAWRKLPAEERLPGFGHVFVWWRSGQFLLGRMWATSDHALPPRTEFPLIVCLHVAGVPLGWALRNLLPALEEASAFCGIQTAEEIDESVRQARNSDAYRDELRTQVRLGLDRLQRELQARVADAPPVAPDAALTVEERRQFVAAPELGPVREGLLRILHQVHVRFSAYRGRRSTTKAGETPLQPAQVRVPKAAPSLAEGLGCWTRFFHQLLAPDTPILLTAPMDGEWIDVTAGEPAGDEFFCLRASLKAVPVASSIPFALEANLREEGSRVIDAFLANKPLPRPEPATDVKESATAFFRKVTAKTDAPSKPGSNRKLWMICGLTLMAVVAGSFALFRLDRWTRPARAASAPPSPTPAPQPVISAAPREDEFTTAFNDARTAEQAKDLVRALAGYEAALILRPDHAECVQKVASLRRDLAANEAESRFTETLAAARAAEQTKDYAKASVFYQAGLKLKPDNAECRQKAAAMQQAVAAAAAAAEFSQIVSAARVAAAAEQEFNGHLIAARVAEQAKDDAAALAHYEAALKLRPGHAECVNKVESLKRTVAAAATQKQFRKTFAAAQAAEQAKDLEKALAGYQEARSLKPDDPECARRLEFVQKRIAAAAVEKKFTATLAAAQEAERTGDFRTALARYEEALKLRPDDPECEGKARLLRQTVAAAAALDEALSAAQQAEQARNYTAALAAYQKAVKLSPGHVGAAEGVARMETALQASAKPVVTGPPVQPVSPLVAVSPPASTDPPVVRAAAPASPAAPPTKTLKQLDDEFEVYLVRFEVLKPEDPRIRNTEARKEKGVSFVSIPDKEQYSKRVEWLEGNYREGGWLNQEDRAKYLKKLKDAIKWR